jgi:hypothetical protein
MTQQEYGYIYVVHTVGPAPAMCVVLDGAGGRLLEGCHGLLRAANQLGAYGWIVSGQGERTACPSWVNDLISHIDGVGQGDSMMCYFMRRPVEAGSRAGEGRS